MQFIEYLSSFIIFCSFLLLFSNISHKRSTIDGTVLMIPACPSPMCSFKRGNIEGTNSLKFLSDVWVCFVFAK